MRKVAVLGPPWSYLETTVGEPLWDQYLCRDAERGARFGWLCLSPWVQLCLKSDLPLDFSVVWAILILLHPVRVGANCTSYVIRKVQIETAMRYHFTSIRMAKIQNTDNTKCWSGSGAVETLIHCLWECKWYSLFGRQFANLWQNLIHFRTSPQYLPKGVENLCLHKNLYMIIYSSFIHNCQNLEANKMFFTRWMNK